MRTRIKGLVAVVIASAAIGGALAAPASADPPILDATWTCTVNGVPFGPAPLSGTPMQVHQALHLLRSVTCDQGTLEYTITKR
jgi:hypothetical protein